MRNTYEPIVGILSDLATTMMGVKKVVMEQIDLQSFWYTIMRACNIGRFNVSMEGYMLTEYQLDARLKDLIPPKGVFISSDYYAEDLLLHDEIPYEQYITKVDLKDGVVDIIDDDNIEGKSIKSKSVNKLKLLNPSEFMVVQSQFIGAMRKSVEFNTNLEDATKEVELASIASRTVYDGNCHYNEVPYLPIPLSVVLFSTPIWYNTPVENVLKELSIAVLKQFK